jgi:hypothetical protein
VRRLWQTLWKGKEMQMLESMFIKMEFIFGKEH